LSPLSVRHSESVLMADWTLNVQRWTFADSRHEHGHEHDPMNQKFTLIGSGLAGGLLAAYLGRREYEVDLYERRADPRAGNFVGGRSINLALSSRGIHALQQLGIADEVLKHAIPMRGRMIHDKSGNLHFAPYDVAPNKHIKSIGRAALNTTVIAAAERSPN